MTNKILILILSSFIFAGCSTLKDYESTNNAEKSCSSFYHSCYDLGKIHLKKKEYTKAKKAFKRACSIFDEIPINSSLASHYITFSCLELSILYKTDNPSYSKQIFNHVLHRHQRECSSGNKDACQSLKNYFY